jgi:hypothetical protein
MADKNLTLKQFIFGTLHFPDYIVRGIKYYLLLNFVLALIAGAYSYHITQIFSVTFLFYFTFTLIMMPIVMYIGSCLRRVKNDIQTKTKTKVTYWLFSRYILHLAIIVILYLWLAIVLLSSLLTFIH